MDPNKYKKNKDIRPESLLATITSIASISLVVLGVIGLALDLFKNDGFLEKIYSYLLQLPLAIPLIIGALFLLWLLNRWISSPGKNETKKSGNLLLYIMILIGVYYAFQLITTGEF